MADIKKCDRCGKPYEPYPKNFDELCVCTRKQSTMGAMLRIEQDLCMDCCKDLEKFMKMEEPIDVPSRKTTSNWGTFETYDKANHFITALKSAIDLYGYVTVEDACHIFGIVPNYSDRMLGWTNLSGATIYGFLSELYVALPVPRKIRNINITCGAKYDCIPNKE